MAFDVGSLVAKLKLDTKGFQAGIQQATGQMKGMQKQSLALSSALGKTLAIGALGALTIGFKKATDAAGDFEKSMANVSTLVDTAVVDINELSTAVLDMTTEVLKSSEDLSAGLYQVFSAGISDSAEAMDVLRVSAVAATAGLADTRSSVDAITTILNAYGLEAREATNISDLMFQTVKLGKTTFSELSASIGTVIAPAASLGIELKDLFASLATLTKGGFDTRVATTALRATFLSILKPSEEAAKLAKELGLEWDASALKAKGLVSFLNEMKEATGGNTEQLSTLIPETRALNAALALTGEQSQELNKILGEMGDAAGSTQEAFEKQAATFDAQAAKFGIMVDKIKISIGNVFLPAITAMLQEINSLFEGTSQSYQDLIALLSKPLPQAIIKNAESLGQQMVDALFPTGGLSAAVGRYEQATRALLEHWRGITVPLKETVDGLTPAFDAFAKNVQAQFKKTEKAGTEAATNIKKTWEDLPESIKTAFETLGVVPKEQFQSQVKEAVSAFETIVSEQKLSNQELLELRQALFEKVSALAEENKDVALGVDLETFRQELAEVEQEVLDKSTGTAQAVTSLGGTTTVVLRGFLQDSTQLASDAVQGIELLLEKTTNAQVASFKAILGWIDKYRDDRIAAEEAITEVISVETEKQSGLITNFVLNAEGQLARLQSQLGFGGVSGNVPPAVASETVTNNTFTFNGAQNVETVEGQANFVRSVNQANELAAGNAF